MIIRKNNERIPERELNIAEVMALNNICHSVSKDRIEHYIHLFNDASSSLEKYEICFLVNYVTKGRINVIKDKCYNLYVTNSGKKIILSKDEIENGCYTVVDDDISLTKIIEDLEKEGFKILETEESLLAFCEERNIVFYSNSIKNAIKYYCTKEMAFFQQPRVTYDGEKIVSHYSTPDQCKKKKSSFPLFSSGTYLWLYDPDKDEDSVFNSSMKRIAQYPELYNAVGAKNKALINNIVLSKADKPLIKRKNKSL